MHFQIRVGFNYIGTKQFPKDKVLAVSVSGMNTNTAQNWPLHFLKKKITTGDGEYRLYTYIKKIIIASRNAQLEFSWQAQETDGCRKTTLGLCAINWPGMFGEKRLSAKK